MKEERREGERSRERQGEYKWNHHDGSINAKRTIREYYDEVYAYKLNNLDKMDQFHEIQSTKTQTRKKQIIC